MSGSVAPWPPVGSGTARPGRDDPASSARVRRGRRPGGPSRRPSRPPSGDIPRRRSGAGPVGSAAAARRRSWPARSSPTSTSPRSRSYRAGSPRARSVSTVVSVTVRAASAAENGRWSKRSGGANRPRPGTMSGSPVPPGDGSSPTLARVRGPGGSIAPGGSSSTIPAASSSGSARRALSDAIAGRRPADHRGDHRLRAAVDELDDPPVAGHRRLDGLESPPDRGRPASSRAAAATSSTGRRSGRSAAASRPSAHAVPW